MYCPFKARILRLASAFLVAICSAVQLSAGGIYLGSGIGLEDVKTRYDNRGDTRLFPTLSLSDLVFSEDKSGDGTPYTLSAFLGYRLDLQRQGTWVALEASALLRGDTIEGSLSATGFTLDGSQLPNLLVEDWKFRAESDRSLVAKLGTYITLFGFFDLSVYMLGGKREVGVAFERNFEVCTNVQGCTAPDQRSQATETREPVLEQWVGGVGIEKFIGDRSAIQLELRLNDEGSNSWKDNERSLEIPKELTRESYDLSLRLLLQF